MSCDTLAITQGTIIFAKNSDRPVNEEQRVYYIPASNHEPDEMVKATYISIPQVNSTYACILSRPSWMFGGEMGVNEHGVAIGNEALFLREPFEQENKFLLGMDILRLALERSSTSDEAFDCITTLLAQFGQGGNHYGPGFTPACYHSSFLVIDRSGTGWIIETAGKYWVAKAIDTHGFYTISNACSIEIPDRMHESIVLHAIERGWCSNEDDFNFKRCFSASSFSWQGIKHFVASGEGRARFTEDYLAKLDSVSVIDIMKLMRMHQRKDWSPESQFNLPLERNICAHDGWLDVMNTTASMIVDLTNMVVWVTNSSAPCTSIYKPLTFDACQVIPECIDAVETPPLFTLDSLWWKHELLHRNLLRLDDFKQGLVLFSRERDDLEIKCNTDQNREISVCWREADEHEDLWLEAIRREYRKNGCCREFWTWLYRRKWASANRCVKIEL